MKRDILGLALAGGRSRRLGQDKALLVLRDGLTQLDYVLSILGKFCSKVAVSGREEQRSIRSKPGGPPFIPDLAGVEGPMSGVISGLRSEPGWPLLATACDLPMIDASLVLKLISRRNQHRKATCFLAEDDRPEPLFAIYEPAALEELEDCSSAGNYSLRRFLENTEVEKITCGRPFLMANVNTLEDLKSVREQLAIESD